MKFGKINNKGRARLFKNQYVEYLTKTHPLVIWAIYLPVIIYFPYYAINIYDFNTLRVLLIFLGGVFFWTFFEYIVHRYIFHWVSENPGAKRVIYIIHGNHHEFPRDIQRLFMPPVPSIIAGSIIFMVMYIVMATSAFVFFPGFLLGYLLYGSVHYAIHAWNPPFKWLKSLWRNHHLHHYKTDEKGFGVSTSFWDKVFGTSFDFTNVQQNKEKV